MTAEEIARALHGRPSGDGWIACCVAHDDREPSLSLSVGDDGRPLVHCHAGCTQADVIAALKGLGLWPDRQEHIERRIVSTCYNYTDVFGNLLYQVCRTEPKGFFQRVPDGAGGWINRGPRDEERVLFHLREVIDAPIVFLCEGEKDVERLREHHFAATCEAGGANTKWLPRFTEALRGREVILIPDRDKPGYARVKRIARALLGNVARLIYLELEDGKDVSEWFERGHSELELIAQLDGEEVSR